MARGVLYSWLAWLCADLVIDANSSAGGGKKEDDVTARILDFPLGRWLVAAAGLAVLGAGAWNVYRGLSQKFRKNLKEQQMGGEERRWYTALGSSGTTPAASSSCSPGSSSCGPPGSSTRRRRSASTARWPSSRTSRTGTSCSGLAAAGLLAYALFSLVEARYREV